MRIAPAARIIALCVVAATLREAPAEPARTLRTGTDAELARALADVRPGDTILVADGTYRESLIVKRSGEGAGQPITIKADHPRKAVFTRKGQAARIDGSFLRFEGLVFDSQYGNCTCVRAAGRGSTEALCRTRG